MTFFLFLWRTLEVYLEQNPGVKTMRNISKIVAKKWKTLTYDEKVQYYNIVIKKWREFDQATIEQAKRKKAVVKKKLRVSLNMMNRIEFLNTRK